MIIPAESVELALKDVPEGVDYEIVPVDALPADRFFRNAWKANGAAVQVDMEKAKIIGHDIRRAKRAEEFAPHDEVIAKRIPGTDAVEAENKRQEIRDKYDDIQQAIDDAATPDEIKTALDI